MFLRSTACDDLALRPRRSIVLLCAGRCDPGVPLRANPTLLQAAFRNSTTFICQTAQLSAADWNTARQEAAPLKPAAIRRKQRKQTRSLYGQPNNTNKDPTKLRHATSPQRSKGLCRDSVYRVCPLAQKESPMPKHATMSKARLTFAAVALFAMNTSVNASK